MHSFDLGFSTELRRGKFDKIFAGQAPDAHRLPWLADSTLRSGHSQQPHLLVRPNSRLKSHPIFLEILSPVQIIREEPDSRSAKFVISWGPVHAFKQNRKIETAAGRKGIYGIT